MLKENCLWRDQQKGKMKEYWGVKRIEVCFTHTCVNIE
jgi:hypothetical protein